MALNLVMIGPPGAGKGTQAARLCSHFGIPRISTGEILREAVTSGTPLGNEVKDTIGAGRLVSDDLMISVVRDRLSKPDALAGFVLDGFPRTVAQAEALDKLLKERGRSLSDVLLLDVPREELLARLGARATCSRCQTVYSLAVRPPKAPGICDRCGGPVSATARSDESPEVVKKRLEIYDSETKPVIDYYEKRGLLQRVVGVGTMEEIGARLTAILDRRKGRDAS